MNLTGFIKDRIVTQLRKTIGQLLGKKIYPNRSRFVNKAFREKIAQLDRKRLARECAKLNPEAEQALADEVG
jgi:hypothetical protein